ncbi:MAG TPA: tetratricopeptide repeat protein [Acidobacteriota bacterium]|nr:tetratricopeptide repeat protein [Acidobacteriota bacterium]
MRRRFVRILVLAVFLVSAGCAQKKVQVSTPAPESHFDVAQQNYSAGNYTAAIASYQQYLQQNDEKNREIALFRLAASHALRNQAPDDLIQAQSLFGRLIQEYPSTPLADQAKLLASSLKLVTDLEERRRQNEEHLQRLSLQVATILERMQELEKRQEAERNDPLRRAAEHLRNGRIKEAAKIYEAYLADESAPHGDEAAFRLALIQLGQGTGSRDNRQTLNLLERISRDWPKSPYANQARQLLTVYRDLARLRSQVENQQAELKQLNEALDALKAIDLKRKN